MPFLKINFENDRGKPNSHSRQCTNERETVSKSKIDLKTNHQKQPHQN